MSYSACCDTTRNLLGIYDVINFLYDQQHGDEARAGLDQQQFLLRFSWPPTPEQYT